MSAFKKPKSKFKLVVIYNSKKWNDIFFQVSFLDLNVKLQMRMKVSKPSQLPFKGQFMGSEDK